MYLKEYNSIPNSLYLYNDNELVNIKYVSWRRVIYKFKKSPPVGSPLLLDSEIGHEDVCWKGRGAIWTEILRSSV